MVDAQLPRRLARWLARTGHDAVHPLDLPAGNRTSDSEVMRFAASEQRVVVTKDDDFVQSHLILEKPSHLLLIATGNIGNHELAALLERHLPAIEAALSAHRFVEVGRQGLVIHG